MTSAESPTESATTALPFWLRLVEGRTKAQRLVITLGALAGAIVAIAGLASGAARLLHTGRSGPAAAGPAATDGSAVRIDSRTAGADEFVRYLLDHVDGPPVQLNHQLLGRPGPGNVSLDYACATASGCSTVRIEDGEVTFSAIENGVWFQGCYRVRQGRSGVRGPWPRHRTARRRQHLSDLNPAVLALAIPLRSAHHHP